MPISFPSSGVRESSIFEGPAAAAVTEQNILHYLRYLEQRVSSVTLAQSIYKIARVAHCLAPGRDWRWLQRVARRLELRAKPRDKRNDVVSIKELFQLGRQLMDQAEKNASATNSFRALLYRDGLIIALLAADPLRLANITALEIGRTFIKDGTTWSIDIPPEETKARRLHLAILPDWSAPCIDRYVEHYRTFFPNAESTNRLWLSQDGRPLTADGLYRLVCKRTLDALRQARQSASVSLLPSNQHCRPSRCAHRIGDDGAWPYEHRGHRAPLQSSQDDRCRAGLPGTSACR